MDQGVDVADAGPDDQEQIRRIPTDADFLFAYSTTPGECSSVFVFFWFLLANKQTNKQTRQPHC